MRAAAIASVITTALAGFAACGLSIEGSASSVTSDGGASVDGSTSIEDGGGGDDVAPIDAAPLDPDAALVEPFVLATGLSSPHAVVVVPGQSAAFVAENNRGDIRRVPLDGGAHTAWHETRQAPRGLAAGTTGIYWTEQTKVGMKTFAGIPSTRDFATGDGQGVPILFATDQVFIGTMPGNKVFGTDINLNVPREFANTQGGPHGLAVTLSHVYWTAREDKTISRRDRYNVLAQVEVVIREEAQPEALVIDTVTQSLIWSSGGSIRAATLGVFAPRTLIEGEGRVRALAIDSGILYWLDSDRGTVRKMRTTGGPAVTLAINERQQTTYSFSAGIGFDAANVYFIASEAGTLKRVPK